MKKNIFICLICVFILSHAISLANSNSIAHIQINDDVITPVTADYIDQSIEKAVKHNMAALIVELDTPGGLLTSTRRIVKSILNSPLPIITYVSPSGARAGSAGVFITMASHVAAMAPGTNIGAAHPVNLDGSSSQKKSSKGVLEEIKKLISDKNSDTPSDHKKESRPADQESDTQSQSSSHSPMKDKVMNDTLAWVRSIAKLRNRNVDWAVSSVRDSASIIASEALDKNVIDIVATDINDLLVQLQGLSVKIGGKSIVLNADMAVVTFEKGFRLHWLSILAHPNIAYILMMLGFYGLLFEFTHPGIGFPGIAGAICLVLAFFGMQILPTNTSGILLIIIGIALLVAEIKVTSYGLLSLGGIISMLFGSVLLFDDLASTVQLSYSLIVVFTVPIAIIAALLIGLISKVHCKKSVMGKDALIGLSATVIKWRDGHGQVYVHGEIWNAQSSETVLLNQRLTVVGVNGLTLTVLPLRQ